MTDTNKDIWIKEVLAEQIKELSDNKSVNQTNQTNQIADTNEINHLKRVVSDLENRILRYESRWYFVFFKFLFTFIQTYFIRLPLTICLLVFHIFAIKLHRFFVKHA